MCGAPILMFARQSHLAIMSAHVCRRHQRILARLGTPSLVSVSSLSDLNKDPAIDMDQPI